MSYLRLTVPHTLRRQAADALAAELDSALSTYTDVRPQRDVPIAGTNLVADVLYKFPLGWGIGHVLLTAPVDGATLQAWTTTAGSAGVDLVFWLWGGARLDDAVRWISDRAGAVYFVRQPEAGSFRYVLARRRGAPPDTIPTRDAIAHATERWLRHAIVRYFELWGPLDGLRMERALDGDQALRRTIDRMLAEVAETSPVTGEWAGSAAIELAADGTWVAERLPGVYPEIPRLLQAGRVACRVAAHIYAEAPNDDAHIAWLPACAGVTYRGDQYASRLVAQWAVFFEALAIDVTYAPEVDLTCDDDVLPDFWLPGLRCLLITRRLAPEADDLRAAQRLAVRTNFPVILLHGSVGIDARGVIFLPEPSGAPVIMDRPAHFRWAGCRHCGQLLGRAELPNGVLLALCANPGCNGRECGLPAAVQGRPASATEAAYAAATARFEPWRPEREASRA